MTDPFPKSKQLARGERRYRRKVASPKQWAAIRAEKGDACRLCGALQGIQMHHLVSRAALGDDCVDNIVGLCERCHDCVTRRVRSDLADLAELLTNGEYAYCIGKLGEGAMSRIFGVLENR